ncbi:MAG: oxidoreductase [Acidimicrobiales bacterium]|nr:oxidoreductase [Acidimicrobiales bacterium]
MPVKPRLGFLGVGWIGRDRLLALDRSDVAEVVAVADLDADAAEAVAARVGARVVGPDELLANGCAIDGVVIATPSGMHAAQSLAALRHGLAVFCQKPLGRDGDEVASVVEAARRVDRLLGVDLSYRHAVAFARARAAVRSGAIGHVYAADLAFHNAYAPGQAWCRDLALAGGGCVIDLGTHLVDLALWTLDPPGVDAVSSRLFACGQPVGRARTVVEDHAVARLDLVGGAAVTVACSWCWEGGCDAAIGARFHGTGGAVSVTNVGGSFYDLRAEEHHGTATTVLAEPPDLWGGRGLVAWADQLGAGGGFDPAALDLVAVATTLDRVYAQ